MSDLPEKKNSQLHAAKKNKNDEFYTRLTDIEKEVGHYAAHLRGKVVFCNCDDPEWSAFWKHFTLKFHDYGLRKVISTHYANGSPSYKLEYSGAGDPVRTPLGGDGDFRSDECLAILAEADIVITNPPFSLFREYISQLIEHGKQFLVIGNNNAITYKEVFKFIKANQLWMGVSPRSMTFKMPDGTEKPVNACWFTNLTHKKRTEPLTLYAKYSGNEAAYPKYDNYGAIEVSQVKNIPADYDGVMGVPITFLDKYNPAQFEILGLLADKREQSEALIQGTPIYLDEQHKKYVGAVLKGKATYARIIIKNKAPL